MNLRYRCTSQGTDVNSGMAQSQFVPKAADEEPSIKLSEGHFQHKPSPVVPREKPPA